MTPTNENSYSSRSRRGAVLSDFGTLSRTVVRLLDENAISVDIKVGNAVRIRRTWRTPYAGSIGVVSAIEPSDLYGIYMIEFEDGLQFRYKRYEFEPMMARPIYYHERAVSKLLRYARLLVRRLA
jgi:hypothetical protein